jgi:Flp pilus assembly protein TadD
VTDAAAIADLLRSAWAQLRGGQVQQARLQCEQVVQRDPANFDGWRMLAMARQALGDDAGAGLALERAQALRPDDPGTAFDRGSWLLQRGDPGAARPLLELATRALPAIGRVAFRHGTACFLDNDFAAAAASFRRAVELEPQWSEAWNNLAAALGRLQDYPAAIGAACSALRLQPQVAASHQALAALLSNLFDPESLREGLAAAERALELAPDLAEAHRNAAILLRKLGEPVRAEVHARRAYELAPGDPDTIETLGDQLMLNGRVEMAAALYAAARQAGVDTPSVIRQHGIALLRQGQADAAHAALAEAVARRPDDQRAIAHLGLALASSGQVEAAIDLVGLQRHIHAIELPVPVGFASADAFHQALAADIRRHSQQRWEPAGLAARNAYLSGDLLADGTAAIVGFEQRLREAIDAFLRRCRAQRAAGASDTFLAGIPQEYRIHVWATQAAQSGYIDTHIHEDSWLSGAYYVELPPAIAADDASHAGWIEFGRPYASLPPWPEHAVRRVLPQVGTLLLFPSYLFHRTLPYAGEGERISISFDLGAA